MNKNIIIDIDKLVTTTTYEHTPGDTQEESIPQPAETIIADTETANQTK